MIILKRIIIEGNKPLSGKIKIGGAKNSVVALIPAAIMANAFSHRCGGVCNGSADDPARFTETWGRTKQPVSGSRGRRGRSDG